ncbi:MAG TPA: response regulator [Chloroflexi bacterium]|nr:response regulator [Chloroflexota bacterium]
MNDPLALVIEDDPDAAAIFSGALEAAEFEVEVISAGDKALERLARVEPKLIVLDLHLPQVAGPDILRHIRADRRLANVHVIVASADAMMAGELRDQVTLVLLKPISYSQFRDMAKRLKSQIVEES